VAGLCVLERYLYDCAAAAVMNREDCEGGSRVSRDFNQARHFSCHDSQDDVVGRPCQRLRALYCSLCLCGCRRRESAKLVSIGQCRSRRRVILRQTFSAVLLTSAGNRQLAARSKQQIAKGTDKRNECDEDEDRRVSSGRRSTRQQ
jgi:hypothetical protein